MKRGGASATAFVQPRREVLRWGCSFLSIFLPAGKGRTGTPYRFLLASLSVNLLVSREGEGVQYWCKNLKFH